MSREILSASAMNTLAKCPREFYYRYELGVRPTVDADVLRFGSAWHSGMQARWLGKTYEQAFDAACNTADGMDEKVLATLSALLAAYYKYYGDAEVEGEIKPEVEFRYPIERSLTFDAAGKIDCLIIDGNKAKIVEHKTTSEDISDGSQYWDRLRYNVQIFQYFLGVQKLGYNIDTVIFDVTRKPMIQPKTAVPELDADGKKIVIDADGNRIFLKNGEPRQSADLSKGYVVKTREESLDEFSNRLFDDCVSRPEFYFARREVPILIQDIESFIDDRIERGKQILHYRARQKKVSESAWPRNVGMFTCRNCAYSGFCLQGVQLDTHMLPPGFESVKNKHVELQEVV